MKRYALVGLVVLTLTNRLPVIGPTLNLVCVAVLAAALIRHSPKIRLRWVALAFLATPHLPNALAAFAGLWIAGTLTHRLATTKRTRLANLKNGHTR